MKRFAEWAINYKRLISGSLTMKTFLILLVLFFVICTATYLFIGLFLPFANENRSRRLLDEKSKALVAELRVKSASESGKLFIQFIKETGSDLKLLNANREPVDLFSFTNIYEDVPAGQEYPFRFSDSDREYILVINYNTVRSDEISEAISLSMPWVGSMILFLSVISALLFSRYTTRPIIRMSKIAANIANLDFSWYSPDIRDDEIGTLSKSLNELSDKLSAALAAMRRQNLSLTDQIALEKERERRRLLFFSGVSHELKTPIAIVIGQIEGMQAGVGVYKDRDKYLARCSEILYSLNNFIKEILMVSHMDITEITLTEQVDLSSVLESIIDETLPLIKSNDISTTYEITPGVFISGNKALLKKALGNIIINAILYTGNTGHIDINLNRSKNEAALEVINTPAHIDESHLPNLFDAFYRADNTSGSISGKGSGLGLYITRMILERHSVPHTISNFGDGVKFSAVFKI